MISASMEESQGSEYSSVSGSISIDFWQFFMQASKIFLSSRIGVFKLKNNIKKILP